MEKDQILGMKVYWKHHVWCSNENKSVRWPQGYGRNLVDPNKVLSVCLLHMETHNKEAEEGTKLVHF